MTNQPDPDSKLSIISEFWDFLKTRKKWWLGPIVLIMLLMGFVDRLNRGKCGRSFYLHSFLNIDLAKTFYCHPHL